MRIPLIDSLPPAQRQVALIGIPIVAALVITRAVRGKSEPVVSGTIPGTASTDAIGSGELAGWMDSWADALFDVQTGLDQLTNASSNTPSTSPADPVDDSDDATVWYPIPTPQDPNPAPVVDTGARPSSVEVVTGNFHGDDDSSAGGYTVFLGDDIASSVTAATASQLHAESPGSIIVAPRRSRNPVGADFSAENIARIAREQAARLRKKPSPRIDTGDGNDYIWTS